MLKPKQTPIAKTGWKELAWFVALWLLGVGVVGLVGGILHYAIAP